MRSRVGRGLAVVLAGSIGTGWSGGSFAQSGVPLPEPHLVFAAAPEPLGPFCSAQEKAAAVQELRSRRREARLTAAAAEEHHRWLVAEAERRGQAPLSAGGFAQAAAAYAEVLQSHRTAAEALARQSGEIAAAPVVRCQALTGQERCGGPAPLPTPPPETCGDPARRR
ncbi:MAG TPA: hypothetical protein VF699_02835 [Caulobacteraceae bacterium]|jgi:hypothetical protein